YFCSHTPSTTMPHTPSLHDALPILSLRFQDLADEAKGILFGDSNQDDRQVARDAVRPQGFLAERVVGQYFRACTERPVQALKYRSEEHTSELQSRVDLVCRLLLEQK